MYFPANRDAESVEAEEIDISELTGNGESILVIDDESQQRDIASQMLTLLGYQVETVASGEDAVRYLQENTVDLLMLDMVMDPGMGGKETYEKIQTIHPGQKAIIASGFSTTAIVINSQELSAAMHVKKPYTLNQLGKTVKLAIKQK